MFARLVAMGWRNLARNPRRTWITVVALAGGLALSVATWVFIDGWLQASIEAMVGGQAGHLQVQAPGQLAEPNLYDVVPEPDEVVARLLEDPRVEAASARIHAAAYLSGAERASGTDLWGVDPVREPTISDWRDEVSAGRFVEGPGEVVLGVGLAAQLEVGLDDEVVALTQAADGSLGNTLWTVVGLSDSVSEVRDRSLAIVTLAEAQELLALTGAHLVVARLFDTDAAVPVVRDLAAQPGWTGVVADLGGAEAPVDEPQIALVDPSATLVARSWRAVNPFMGEMYDLTAVWSLFTVGIVLGAAGMGAMNTLLMSVLERTRELGIMQALGLRPPQVVLLILFESLALGLVATVFGVAFGALLSWWAVDVGFDFSSSAADFQMGGVSIEPVLRGRWSWQAFAWPVAVLMIIAALASLIPAIRAARLNPVRAMAQR